MVSAFVTTNSVAQGTQIPIYGPMLQAWYKFRISFQMGKVANNAVVTVVIIGIGQEAAKENLW